VKFDRPSLVAVGVGQTSDQRWLRLAGGRDPTSPQDKKRTSDVRPADRRPNVEPRLASNQVGQPTSIRRRSDLGPTPPTSIRRRADLPSTSIRRRSDLLLTEGQPKSNPPPTLYQLLFHSTVFNTQSRSKRERVLLNIPEYRSFNASHSKKRKTQVRGVPRAG
jgi:hypothetical protein